VTSWLFLAPASETDAMAINRRFEMEGCGGILVRAATPSQGDQLVERRRKGGAAAGEAVSRFRLSMCRNASAVASVLSSAVMATSISLVGHRSEFMPSSSLLDAVV